MPTTQPIPTGYKSSPLGPIPQDWEFNKLGNLGEFNTSSVDKVIVKGEKIVNLLNYMDVYRNRYINSNFNFLETSVKESELKTFDLKNGDIMFTPSSETPDDIGHSSVITEDLKDTVFSYHLIRFRLENDKKLSIPFRGYVFNNFLVRKEFFKKATGSTRYTLSKSSFENSFAIFPESLPEQTAIATILSTVDTTIHQTQEIIRKLEIRNKGLGQKLLYNKKRDWVPIKSFSKEVSQKNKNDEDLTVLSCTKHHGLVPSLEYFGKRIFSNDLTTYKIVAKKCFAYATNHIEEGSIGYQDQYENALISPMYTVFQTNEIINDYFLFKILKSHKYIHEYQKRMEGSIDRRGGLRRDEFAKIKVPVPSMEEQEKIMLILDKATQQINQYKQKLAKLQTLKKGLMQQLLTGKVRVKVK